MCPLKRFKCNKRQRRPCLIILRVTSGLRIDANIVNMIKTIIFWLSLCPCLIIASLLLEIPAIIIFPISPRLSRKYTGVVVSCAWFRLMAVSIMDNITLFQFSFFSIYAVWLIQAMLGKLNLLAAQLLQKLYITTCMFKNT